MYRHLPVSSVVSGAEAGPHLCVLLQVRRSGSRVTFLLVDKETDQHHREQNITFKREAANLKLLPRQPRVVEMKKGSNGYGFYLRAGPEQRGKAGGSRTLGSVITQLSTPA